VVNLGESISAKIDTLIDRAAVMVVDATSPYTQFELGLAISRAQEESSRLNRRPLRIIPVVTEFAQLQGAGQNIAAIRRPLVLSDDDEFIWQLAKALEAIAEEMGLAQRYEPRRLLKAKEYRAAVIARHDACGVNIAPAVEQTISGSCAAPDVDAPAPGASH
jgi:hypothetical protein